MILKALILIIISFLNSITGEILSQTNSLCHKCSTWMLFLLKFDVVLYGRSVMLYYTRDKKIGTLSLSSRPLYSNYPLRYHFEPPIIIYFVVIKWRIMSQSWTLMSYVWFLLKLDRSFITLYDLKLSMRLLFGIMNILNLGWGTSRNYLSKREKWKKKNVDYHGSTQKKIEKWKEKEPKT